MPGGRYPHIIAAVLGEPWAIDRDSLAWAAIQDVLALRAAGERLEEAEIQARIDAARNGPREGAARRGPVAVLPLYGVMMPRASLMAAMSGGVSAEQFGADLEAAASDPEIAAIVIDADSPGGNVAGITELAGILRDVAARKPVAVVANHLLASAAYWSTAGATEIVATPSAIVGSIGVIAEHQDLSGQMEQRGVKTTLITAGKYKAEGHPYGPLEDDTRAEVQGRVDETYGVMVRDIGKGRGVSPEVVRDAYGQGRTMSSKKALEAGLIDRIDSLANTVKRAQAGTIGRTRVAPPAALAGATDASFGWVVPPSNTAGDVFTNGTTSTVIEISGQPAEAPDDQPPVEEPDQGAAGTDPTEPERVVPARRAQLRTRLAAHAGGHALAGSGK